MTSRLASTAEWGSGLGHPTAPEPFDAHGRPDNDRIDRGKVALPAGRPAPRWLRPLLKRLPGKHIELEGKPYLTRWMIRGDGSGESWEVYIHRLHRIDVSRFLHNHPWLWFLAIVLAGRYRQDTINSRVGKPRSERVNWFNLLVGQHQYHAIRELSEGGAWTLMITPPRNGHMWGFWDSERQVHVPDDEDPESQASSETIYFDRDMRIRDRKFAGIAERA